MKKMLTALLLLFASLAQATPLFRFGELVVNPAGIQPYREAIIEDIDASIRQEPNALSMFAMAKADNPADFYIVEIYTDADWEKSHRQTPQYKTFYAKTMATDMFEQKKLIEVEPQYIRETQTPLQLGSENIVQLQRLQAVENPEKIAKFLEQYRSNEAVSIYATQLKNDPSQWYLIEIFANQKAFEQAEKDALTSFFKPLESHQLKGDILMNKGGLKWKSATQQTTKDQPMWNTETLNKINQADDLKIAPFHPDMTTTGTPTWIWEVVVDGRLYVRAYSGVSSRWYQAALKQKAGKIHAIGNVFDVAFKPISDEELNQKIDAAYRAKYSSSRYMQDMIGSRARAATVEVLPR